MFLHGFIFFNFWHLERKFFRFLLTNYTKTQAFKKLFIFCWKKWPGDHCGVMSIAKQTRPGEQDFLIFFYWFWLCITFFSDILICFSSEIPEMKIGNSFQILWFSHKVKHIVNGSKLLPYSCLYFLFLLASNWKYILLSI